MRAADDIPHTEVLNQMRNPAAGQPRINRSYMEKTKVLETEDFENDPEFLSTPIVETSNKEKEIITGIRSKHWAIQKQTPRFNWRYPLMGNLAPNAATPVHEYLYKSKQSLNKSFVAGVPGFIKENINPRLKISNCSPVIFRALTLDPRENYRAILQLIDESNGREDINLEYAPSYIHVQLPHANPNDFIGRTFVPNEVVIPIPISENATVNSKTFPGRQDILEVKVKTHSVEMGFAIPVHNIQGQTCNRLIID